MSSLAFKITSRALWLAQMSFIAPHFAEDVAQHIKEVHADIGRDPARFGIFALPRCVIPATSRGDVGQIDLVTLVALGEFIAQRDDRRMKPQLEDSRNAPTGILLDLGKTVDVPRIEDQWLLAYCICPRTHREPAMRIMEMVREQMET